MKILENIVIDKETVSDSEYLISEVYVESGKNIAKGELIFSFETSKTNIDVEAKVDGYVYHFLVKGEYVKVGEKVAVIVPDRLKNDQKHILL